MIKNIYQRFWPLLIALAFVWALVFVDQIYAKGGDIQGRRVALIVGNSNYKSVYSLKNAVSDSTSVSAVLSRLGFEVIEVSDVTKDEFSKALEKFSKAAQHAEAAVFYYSGHGFQLGGTNFLVPVDAKLNNRKTILKETLRLNDVINAVQDRNRQTLIFLDACRNNPLPESVRDKSMIDGLAQLDAGTGTFVAFATQPGNITRDGAGDHSPFAAALIEHMETPGISISDMMIRVRNSVEVATLQTQTPWDQSSLRNQFYFLPEEEVSADLTEEDKALLLSLPPALRKKFAAQFGIKFSDDGVILTQTVQIKRRFSISAGGQEPSETPAADKKPVIKSRFKIAAGDSDDEAPVVVASLEPKDKISSRPELSPLDDELENNGSNFIPLPNFRPGATSFEKQDDQLVASLSPKDTKPEVAQRIDLEPEPQKPPPESSKPETDANTTVPEVAAKPEPEIAAKPEPEVATKPEPEIAAKPEKDVTPAVAPELVIPIQPQPVIPNSPSIAPVVVEKVDTPVIIAETSVPAKTKKPRIIAITNPALSISPKQEVEKDIQVAINSPSRSIATIKPSSTRSSLRPVVISPKRLIGKEIKTGQTEDQKTKPKVQVASLEPAAKRTPEPELEERKIAPIGLDDTPKVSKQEKPEVKIASLDSDNSVANSRSDEAIAPVKEPSITPPSQAFEVQTELARLGCYRSKIDGLWGAISARSLFRYYGNKKIAPTELEPNFALLSMLRNDEVVVCKRTIVKKKRIRKIVTKESKSSRSARKKGGKRIRIRKSVTVRKKALKKSLSKGVFR